VGTLVGIHPQIEMRGSHKPGGALEQRVLGIDLLESFGLRREIFGNRVNVGTVEPGVFPVVHHILHVPEHDVARRIVGRPGQKLRADHHSRDEDRGGSHGNGIVFLERGSVAHAPDQQSGGGDEHTPHQEHP
jgi:hypothetical protein